jgi:hypothetical protein
MPLTETPFVPLAALRVHFDASALASASERAVPDAELVRALRDAEKWAKNICGSRLGPSQSSVSSYASCDQEGSIRVLDVAGRPVVSMQKLKYWYQGSAPVVIERPDGRVDGKDLLFPNAVDRQYLRTRTSNVFHAMVDYVSGWCAAVLVEVARDGDRSLAVEDATWLVPGRQYHLRLATSDDQTVTISPTWTPPPPTGQPVGGTVPIVERLDRSHAAGTTLTDLPTPMHRGIVKYALAVLRAYATIRALEAEDDYPDTPLNAATRYVDPIEVAPALVTDAARLLESYRVW